MIYEFLGLFVCRTGDNCSYLNLRPLKKGSQTLNYVGNVFLSNTLLNTCLFSFGTVVPRVSDPIPVFSLDPLAWIFDQDL